MKISGLKKYLLVSLSVLLIASTASAQTCSKARVKDLSRQLIKADRTLLKNQRSLEQKSERWETRRNNYESTRNSYEDQKLQLLTDITTIEGVVSGLVNLINNFGGFLCSIGFGDPSECRAAVKDHRQAVARLNNFRRRLLTIEQKIAAVSNKRDREGGVIEAELARIQGRITTGQSQVVSLQADLAACQSVAITSPSNNSAVSSPFTLRVTPTAIKMQPKGIVEAASGYLVVIIDGAPVAVGGGVPAGAIELVNGEVRTDLVLAAGPHTIVVQVFRGDGTAYAPQIVKQISVTVTP